LRSVLLATTCLFVAGPTSADIGSVLIRAPGEERSLTVFVEPSPPRTDAARFNLLVQDSRTQQPLSAAGLRLHFIDSGGADARVHAQGEGEGEGAHFEVPLVAAEGAILQQASVDFPHPGHWRMRVELENGEAFSTPLTVAPALRGVSAYRFWFCLTFAGIALIALHQGLSLRLTGAG
jgi:hypothetical protein